MNNKNSVFAITTVLLLSNFMIPINDAFATTSFVDAFPVSDEETSPLGLAFNSDGTKMFVLGSGNVNEYACSTGFDVSTCEYSGDSERFSITGTSSTTFLNLTFNTDGTKMFVVGINSSYFIQYACSTGFDVSTCSFSSELYTNTPFDDIAFNTDGKKLFVLGASGYQRVAQYACSTGFEFSTCNLATLIGSFNPAAHINVGESAMLATSIEFNTDGTKMFVLDDNANKVHEYACGAFTVSTCSFTDDFTIAEQEPLAQGLAFNTDGTKMFVTGSYGDDVNEYTLSVGFDLNTPAAEGTGTETKKGGPGCLDCTAPSIGISNNLKDPVRVIDGGFTLNENSFDVREFKQIHETLETKTGVINHIDFKIYEDTKPENIRKVVVYLGLDTPDIYRNLACIIWENDSRGEKTITIIDKHDLFENESATSTIVDDLLLLNYTFTSKIPIPFSTIGVELRDNQYNFGLNYFENILKVSGNPLISSTGTVSKNNSVQTLIVDTFQHESSDSQNGVTSYEFESGAPFEIPSIMIADTSQWGFSDIMTKRYLADIEETIKENDFEIQALRNADAPKEIPVVELELPRIEENLLQIEQEKAQLILNEILRKDIHNWRESYISHTSEIDIKQLSTLTGIPYDSLQPWMSNLEMWVTEGKIDSAEMIVAVEYLINQ